MLEEETGVDLSQFRVPNSEIKPRVTSYNPRTGKSYSQEVYCERAYLFMKIDALLNKFNIEEDGPKIGF